MKTAYIFFGLLLLVFLGMGFNDFMYGLHQNMKLEVYRKYIADYKGLVSSLVKSMIIGLCLSWLCSNLAYYDSVKPGFDPKPVIVISILDQRQHQSIFKSSINLCVALSVGPLFTLAYVWSIWT